jgi:pimeloyl-ACP methyl ester carboxylesterase
MYGGRADADEAKNDRCRDGHSPGSAWLFVGGWYWDEVGEKLEQLGHNMTAAEQLPSSGTDPAQFGDLAADVADVREQLDALEGPVTLIGHSAGGVVITEVADHPAIGHTIYLAANVATRGLVDGRAHGEAPHPERLDRDARGRRGARDRRR